MPVTVIGGALTGVDAIPIEVEVDLLRRLPAVTIVGLAASAVKESAERVRSAIHSAGAEFPRKRVVVNLMPADVRKEGTALDLPVALGILAADGQIPPKVLESVIAAGELALSGRLRPIRGALPMAVLARELDKTLVLPAEAAAVAGLVPGARVVGANHLGEVLAWLRGEGELESSSPEPAPSPAVHLDLADVRGQHSARLALEIAAAGGHHLLLAGPPGCGKSMLAQRMPTILPPLTSDESLEVTKVHSAAGLLKSATLVRHRPFRAPHHTVTMAGMVGDRTLRPGEVSLAHHGVLFLDEAPEFRRSVLESLRQPLEDGEIHLRRAAGSVCHPAALTLVLAANPCPCGFAGTDRLCRCGPAAINRYQQRLSGPVLDRVDLRVTLTPVSADQLLDSTPAESSAVVRARVVAARTRQLLRGQEVLNARLSPQQLDRHCRLDSSLRLLVRRAVALHGLSGRGVSRLLRVSRTLADLQASNDVQPSHLMQALAFRSLPVAA